MASPVGELQVQSKTLSLKKKKSEEGLGKDIHTSAHVQTLTFLVLIQSNQKSHILICNLAWENLAKSKQVFPGYVLWFCWLYYYPHELS